MEEKLIYPELSYEIMGALYNVFNELGYGYQEKYYQKAVAIELGKKGIAFVREKGIGLEYGNELIGRYFLDFVVEDKIVLEIKVARMFSLKDFRQIYAYLKKTKKKLGILAIFTPKGVRYRRILNITPNYL